MVDYDYIIISDDSVTDDDFVVLPKKKGKALCTDSDTDNDFLMLPKKKDKALCTVATNLKRILW